MEKIQKHLIVVNIYGGGDYMPLKRGKKNISANIRELYRDNKKKGKARGANGKIRSRKQIIAIAMSKARGKARRK